MVLSLFEFAARAAILVAASPTYFIANKKFTEMTEASKLAIEKADKELLDVRKNNKKELALIKAGAAEKYLPMLKREIESDKLNFDDKDTLVGLADLVKGIKESFKECFGEMKIMGEDTHEGINPEITNKWVKAYEEAKTSFEKVKIKQEAFAEGVILN